MSMNEKTSNYDSDLEEKTDSKSEVDEDMYMIVIIAEKPSQGSNIADALGLTESTRDITIDEIVQSIKVYSGVYDDNNVILVPAKGHILELRGRSKEILNFDFNWKSPTKTNKDHLARYMIMKQELSNADEVIIATDADDEGELIGYNIVNHFNVLDKTTRMIFQSMTTRAIQESFASRQDLRINIAKSAELRAWGDKVFGYIFSKFLTRSYTQVTGDQYIELPVGRVMTPPLKRVINNMQSIEEAKRLQKDLKPEIRIDFELKCQIPTVSYNYEDVEIPENCIGITMEEALELKKKYDGTIGVISNIYTVEVEEDPSSSGITIDDIRVWAQKNGIDYKMTDSILEALYLSKLITYPRSESNILPNPEKGEVDANYYDIILDNVIGFLNLKDHEDKIIKQKIPIMGDYNDGAHWAIHPTEEEPVGQLPPDYLMIYEYILRSFLKGFSFPLKKTEYRCDVNVDIGVDKPVELTTTYWETVEDYGYEVIDNNSLLNYEEPEDEPIPDLNEDDEIDCITKIEKIIKSPNIPKRIQKEDLYKFMKDNDLGTDATRGAILEKLWEKNMLRGDPPFVTVLGLRIVEAISSINPVLTDVSMTRDFEQKREGIINNSITLEDSKEKIKEEITAIIKDRLDDMSEIGEKLAFFGECQKCQTRMKLVSWRKGDESFFFLTCTNKDCDFKAPI